MTTVGEWRLGRLVRERYVGFILSGWPEHRSTEWVLKLHLGEVADLTAKCRLPRVGRVSRER